jgi:hypothetical protein
MEPLMELGRISLKLRVVMFLLTSHVFLKSRLSLSHPALNK